jgi:hypothetical protein
LDNPGRFLKLPAQYLVVLALGLRAMLSSRGSALSRQTKVLVDNELAADGVGGGTEREANDDSLERKLV